MRSSEVDAMLCHLARVAHARCTGTNRAYCAIDLLANATHAVGDFLRRLVALIREQSYLLGDDGSPRP
jgi:hypothetical protein